ncbi:hypothetical protein W97_04750 [Coniosporium apollinis CBS 100218]|uniref:Sugar phosphate transporter domain-containing protein n=1 Tax=Coniosporium apollinis (strain CBS 100218) TaxID=1168221 RepID=R7YUD1_CONA1|nr:uncharacterized protein W97_04750 [Coniosporium apollinis CBS 100218]EON65512.1 hypothetical protein W97_04750 [Coniosporium apollinis CBS 100218]
MDSRTSEHRRRSSSIASTAANPTNPSRKHRRLRSKDLHEVQEDKASANEGDDSGETGSSDLELDEMHSDDALEDDEETGLTGVDRKARSKRKRRNTRLDERVAVEGITKEEKDIARQSLIRTSLINALLIGLWYLFSISISIYNKWMFTPKDATDEKSKSIFPFPLFTTSLHMIVQFSLAALVLYLFPSFRPRHDALDPHAPGSPQLRQEPIDPKKPLMTRWFYLTRIGPCGAATGLDIGLGNMSLKFISLTFFTMCKSSVLGFVLLFAFLFRLEKPSWRLGGIIATMTVGVVMMVAGETAFNAVGFILIMSSALSSGFRWSLTQILLLRNPATSNPFSSIFFLAPIMFLSLIVIAIPVEGFHDLTEGFGKLTEAKGNVLGVLILLFPGTLAFLMTSSEFALLKRTSVVTLSICGIFKEVVTISAASVVFKDKLTSINLSGLVVTIGSIAAYNYMKIKKMRDVALKEAHMAVEDYAPVLSTDPDTDGASSDPDARRSSTGRLIRNSLSIQSRLAPERPPIDSPARTSPVKRPEDLD